MSKTLGEETGKPNDSACFDVVVAGKTYLDLIFSDLPFPEPGTEVLAGNMTISPGGAANRAVGAARLGARSALLTNRGIDRISASLFDSLHDVEHLDLTLCQTCGGYHNPVSAAISSQDDRSFITYDRPGPNLAWPSNARTRTLFISLSDGLPEWTDPLHEQGTTIFGGVGWDASGRWSKQVLEDAKHVDVLIMNETEARRYTGQESIQDAMKILLDNVETAVITLGSKGSMASNSNESIEIPAPSVTSVDPTGAGDIFASGLMTAATWSWPLKHCLELATVASSCSVQTPGGAVSAPNATEILEFTHIHDREYDWSWIEDHLGNTE
ncbi:carbohydrate kinase family protein [Bifidobacterium indicum]|uniref:carbohydrate kinase family protein n=1 Tax=Bifidobacterium indicum TaxID=1691 RepID=UPI0030DBF8E7